MFGDQNISNNMDFDSTITGDNNISYNYKVQIKLIRIVL